MGAKTRLGLDERLEGVLCYALGWISGLVILALERENRFVRFHAVQSVATFLGLFLVSLAIGFLPGVGMALSAILAPLSLVLWILLMYQAAQGRRFKLPVIGDFAQQQIGD